MLLGGTAVASGVIGIKALAGGVVLAVILGIVASGINSIRRDAYMASEAAHSIRIAARNAKTAKFILAASRNIQVDKERALKKISAIKAELDKARRLVPKKGGVCAAGCVSHGLFQP